MKNIKKLVIILFLLSVFAGTFYNRYAALIGDIETTAKAKEAVVNRQIGLCKGYIDLMTIYGNDYLYHAVNVESPLYDLLTYDAQSDTYNLDAIVGTPYQRTTGNLTGLGTIPDRGIYQNEIELALHYNQQFNSIYNKLPDIAWLYYTSVNDFIILYPWTASKDFMYSPEIKKEKFYTLVTPENNPLRETLWTPVYMDHAGKGLMVTLSSPIYYNNTFMGAVSIDLTNDDLNKMISSDYTSYIVDETGSVIANGANITYETKVPQLIDMLGISKQDADLMKAMGSHELQRVGTDYVYAVDFYDAPWRLFIHVPVIAVIGKTLLLTLPVLLICLFLLYALMEIEKRKKTEILLTGTLEKLTSYQTLLEKAAKYDFLTSTVNRRGLWDVFTEIQALEKPTAIAFIMGDIDHFKQFNDAHGHAAGDKVLIEITNIIKANIRERDIVCRWGGEEFLVMLVNSTYDEALIIAEKIRAAIALTVIPWDNQTELKATMTFGVAEYCAEIGYAASIAQADTALYYGKETGRNRVVGFQNCTPSEE